MRGKQKEQNHRTVMNLGPPTIRKLKNDRSLSQCNVKTIQLFMPQKTVYKTGCDDRVGHQTPFGV